MELPFSNKYLGTCAGMFVLKEKLPKIQQEYSKQKNVGTKNVNYIRIPLQLRVVKGNSSEQHVTSMPRGFDSICGDYFKQNISKQQIWGDRGKKRK